MKTVCLKERLGRFQLAAQSSFPEGNPLFNLVIFIIRRTKQMNMVRHDQVKANQPSAGGAPGFHQRIMNGIIGKMKSAFAAADCGEHDRRLIAKNKNAFGRMAAA